MSTDQAAVKSCVSVREWIMREAVVTLVVVICAVGLFSKFNATDQPEPSAVNAVTEELVAIEENLPPELTDSVFSDELSSAPDRDARTVDVWPANEIGDHFQGSEEDRETVISLQTNPSTQLKEYQERLATLNRHLWVATKTQECGLRSYAWLSKITHKLYLEIKNDPILLRQKAELSDGQRKAAEAYVRWDWDEGGLFAKGDGPSSFCWEAKTAPFVRWLDLYENGHFPSIWDMRAEIDELRDQMQF